MNEKAPAPPPPRKEDLGGWINRLEDGYLALAKSADAKSKPPDGKWEALTRLDLQRKRQAAESFDSWCWLPPDRKLIEQVVGPLPKKATTQETLRDRLLVVWADAMVWRIIRADLALPPAHTIDDYLWAYLVNKYHLEIPFGASVWLEMIHRPVERAYLFQLMLLTASEFFWLQSLDPGKDINEQWRAEFSNKMLGDLLHDYVHFPGHDWRPSLCVRLAGYPKEVLEWLRSTLNRLSEDIGYIIEHPGRLDGRRAPPVAHRIRTLAEAKAIEEMIIILRHNAGLSDYALAKQHKGSFTAAARKLAREARLLAFYRDGIPLKLHKSRGEKNAPLTSG